MKKLLWIISLFVYLFSVSSLVHASTMGFFGNHQMSVVWSCHALQQSNQGTKDQGKNTIDCCELIYSNQYSISELSFKNFQKKCFSFVVPSTNHFFAAQNILSYKPSIIQSPPWWKTDNKYNNFSDLAWIVVNLI